MYNIFVYGTLKQGRTNHKLLKNAEYLGTYTVEGLQLYSFPNGIPHAIFGEGRITGELYKVDGLTLQQLDLLEGHPHFYIRTPITVKEYEAQIYIGKPSGQPLVESGIY